MMPQDERASALSALEARLDGLSLPELHTLARRLAKWITRREAEEREAAFSALEERAGELGISRAELRRRFGGRSRQAKAAVRYRHPVSGKTWTGVGRKPNWVKDFEANGGRLEDVAV